MITVLLALFLVLATAWPAAAQTPYADRFATVNGLRLHYLEWGDAAKPPLILLHGIARHAHTFDHIAVDFARDYHVLALDMRGHGDSAWSPEGAYLVEDHVKDLEALVAQLGLSGSRCSATPPAAASCRCSPACTRISSSGSSSKTSDRSGRRTSPTRSRGASSRKPTAGPSEDELVAQLVTQNRRTPEPLLRTYAHFGLKPQADGRLVWKRDPNLVKGFVATELWAQVSRITSPTLYVIGGGSRIVPAETQRAVEADAARLRDRHDARSGTLSERRRHADSSRLCARFSRDARHRRGNRAALGKPGTSTRMSEG